MTTAIDFALEGSLVLCLGLLAAALLRRRSAALRHWVLLVSLACAVVAPLAAPLLPAWHPPIEWRFSEAMIGRTDSATSPAVVGGVAQPPSAAVAAAPDGASGRVVPFGRVLFGVWLAGTVLFGCSLLVGLVRLAVLTRRARPVSGGLWVERVAALSTAAGIAAPVRVRESTHRRLLLVWGWRRPTLLVPAAARAWSDDRVASVLQHELAHVRRRDWLTQLGAELVRAVYWFNPLVWMTCARLHVECERACDDAVIAAGVEGRQYAAHLLDVARDLRNGAGWVPAPAIVRASTLERRVRAMLDPTVDRRPLSRRVRCFAGAALLASSAAVATVAAAQQFSTITGTIVDPTNGLLPGVTLLLTNEQTKAKYEITTDRNGRYEFVGLPPGTYQLQSKLPGFAEFRTTLTVGGQPLQQDLMLPLGTLEETITVEWNPDGTPPPAGARPNSGPLTKRAIPPCPPAPPAGVPVIGGNIRVPRKVKDVRPLYPSSLQGTNGDVVLLGRIGTDGDVTGVDILSTTHAEFAQAAIDAVRQWQFDATLLNCVPTEVQMTVNVAFRSR